MCAGSAEEKRGAVWSSLPEQQQSVTEGQRLTSELTAIISQFVQQVKLIQQVSVLITVGYCMHHMRMQ